MTSHLYDPLDPSYYDPAAARAERDRTFRQCSDCRICVRLCTSFKDLFRFVDEQEPEDPTALSDARHRHVVDECYQCKLCYVVCPYTPDQGAEWKIDFPRLMLRSLAIQQREGKVGRSARLLARTDLQGRSIAPVAGLVNRTQHLAPVRVLMEKTTGIARDRLLPTWNKVRFSKWFRRRGPRPDGRRGTVAMFPTCLVEYQAASVGRAMVGVYERNGFSCELPEGQVCCGMPWLDAGDTDKFVEHARKNVAALAPAVRAGRPVVVPQPTCAYVLKQEYPDFLGTGDARAVAAATVDASELLMDRHREEPLDTDFAGRTYESILWHAACHHRAQQIGPRSRDLMALTGAQVEIVERCSAIDGTWGLRAEHVDAARRIAAPLMERVRETEAQLVAGDCQLANNAMREETGAVPSHPLEVLARAYGIEEESP